MSEIGLPGASPAESLHPQGRVIYCFVIIGLHHGSDLWISGWGDLFESQKISASTLYTLTFGMPDTADIVAVFFRAAAKIIRELRDQAKLIIDFYHLAGVIERLA